MVSYIATGVRNPKGAEMDSSNVNKLSLIRAKLLSFFSNERKAAILLTIIAGVILLFGFGYASICFNDAESVMYIFAIAAQCAGGLVLLLEVFGESEEKQLREAFGTAVLWGELEGSLVPVKKVRGKVSEIASKKASAVILFVGYAFGFMLTAPNQNLDAFYAFILFTVGIILSVQSYAIWKMIKFEGDNINLNDFYSKRKTGRE